MWFFNPSFLRHAALGSPLVQSRYEWNSDKVWLAKGEWLLGSIHCLCGTVVRWVKTVPSTLKVQTAPTNTLSLLSSYRHLWATSSLGVIPRVRHCLLFNPEWPLFKFSHELFLSTCLVPCSSWTLNSHRL
jgi:hypothetical protein